MKSHNIKVVVNGEINLPIKKISKGVPSATNFTKIF